jgi:predicted ATPase/Tfp pilus assembly protein PilF
LASLTGGHSLPAERDAFVGRREPLAELTGRFAAGARLVSILGLGGTGKTRLATRFGWSALEEFPGGVWFCDLSQARSVDGIVHAVAQGLAVPLTGGDPVSQLGQAIAARGRCLVILDNFEQVTRHADETLGRWLNRASAASFLVTTREVLGLPGEAILALAPLAPPDAAALFTRRAEAVKPGFQPNADDEAAIARLVSLLDGLPLAIELAAARVRVMPPRMLLLRMSERFKLLSSSGGRVDRQATLRAVFDWSWDLLALPEKAALAQLSVFEGGFTLESVERTLDLSQYENAPWPMDVLQSLVRKSLVRQVTDDRFDLLVSLQEYAMEHLRTPARYAGSGPAALLAAEARHGAYYAARADTTAAADARVDLDNYVVACRRAAARGDAGVAADTLAGAWAGLSLRGPFSVGVGLAAIVQAVPGLGAAAAANVSWVAGRALEACGRDADAHTQFAASRTSARECGDRRSECRALIGLAACDSHAGRIDEARAQFDEALRVAGEIGDRTLQSAAYNGLGTTAIMLGRPDEALAQFEQARDLARKAHDREREGRILANLGVLYINAGRIDDARSHDEAALAAAREIGNRQLEGNVLCNLGQLYQVQGKLAEALEHLDAALPASRDLGDARLESIVLCNLAMVHDGLARFDAARDNFEAALAIARESGDRHREGQFLSYLGLLHARQANFVDARRCLDSGDALLRAVRDRLSLGVALCNRAQAEALAGVPEAASAALAEAEAIAVEIGAGPASELGIALDRARNLRGTASAGTSTVR